ncbi:hypothetical protein K9B35_15075 [Sphingomonas sp. R647]|uniref:hypothetical protein n=1 Tax=Sphingomonas sp. R647 TaxID=2875233 RepID=UPI001CD20F54|nr:hypothetical protein [Sphingomonas sp. R647]MCA1199292.1 hypothetical protein [Sphingomonas sp. R647]
MNALKYVLLWRKLRIILTNALERERGRLGSEQVEIVTDFLSNNEFGLAHDHLLDALSDLELTPLEETQGLLRKAASLMWPSE